MVYDELNNVGLLQTKEQFQFDESRSEKISKKINNNFLKITLAITALLFVPSLSKMFKKSNLKTLNNLKIKDLIKKIKK